MVGSQVSNLALPLTAALVLEASPFQLGLLGTVELLPYLVLGLLAGAWTDRFPRRPILVIADLGRCVALASVPVAALLGLLGMEQLYVVGGVAGVCGVFFNVAYGAFLPAVVPAEHLIAGNSRLALGEAVSRVVGPGLAGVLVQLLTAPLAVAVDAGSFLLSALSVWSIRVAEQARPVASRTLIGEIREGLVWVLGHPTLGPLAIGGAILNLGDGAFFSNSLFILFATRELGLDPGAVGSVVACLGIGGLVGAALVAPITRRLGLGATLVTTSLLPGATLLALNLAPPAFAVPALVAAFTCLGVVNPVFGTTSITLRQALTPNPLLGRVNATVRVLTWGTLPLGSLLGGAIADHVGVRAALLLAAVLELGCCAYLATSPIRRLRAISSAG